MADVGFHKISAVRVLSGLVELTRQGRAAAQQNVFMPHLYSVVS